MATNEESRLRILMFPWLAYGHISPYLELAKKLSKRSFHIYFCSTPINLDSVKKNLNSSDHESIQLVELHLPSSPELPPHYHTTKGLPKHLMPKLKSALKMARPNFINILKTLSPDLVLFDHCGGWLPEQAMKSNNIPAVHFEAYSAVSASFFHHLVKNQGGAPFPASSAIYLRVSEMKKLMPSDQELDSSQQGEDFFFNTFENSHGIVLIKTCKEVEGKYLDYLSNLLDKKVMPVGLLLPQLGNDQKEEEEHTEIMKWLSKKNKSSTVLVSFGSEHYLSKKEIEELAHGLEISNVDFIWIIRFPMGDEVTKAEEELPEGFLERVGERGKIVEGWAPQAKIMGHSSIGGYVSHCGWGSIAESMSLGVPIIAIPLVLDHPLNARLVVELGVGLEVIRDENSEFNREEVARVVKEVVMEKSGEDIRSKAREFSEKIKMQQDREMDDVVEELKKLCNKKSNLG